MPLYVYQTVDPSNRDNSCFVCRKPFELRRSMDRHDALNCPSCGNPIKKLPSTFSSPTTEASSDSAAKAAGFAVIEKKDAGVYEKK